MLTMIRGLEPNGLGWDFYFFFWKGRFSIWKTSKGKTVTSVSCCLSISQMMDWSKSNYKDKLWNIINYRIREVRLKVASGLKMHREKNLIFLDFTVYGCACCLRQDFRSWCYPFSFLAESTSLSSFLQLLREDCHPHYPIVMTDSSFFSFSVRKRRLAEVNGPIFPKCRTGV